MRSAPGCAPSSCVARPPSLPLRLACHENGKAGPAAGNGGDVDAVAQNSERLAHDEGSDAQAVAFCGIKPGERLEDSRNLLTRNSSARVAHIDPDSRTGVPAANKNATSRFAVLDCIADQIAQGGAEKQAIAQYRGGAGNHVDAYAFAQRSLFVLEASLPQHLLDTHRRQFEAPRQARPLKSIARSKRRSAMCRTPLRRSVPMGRSPQG